MALNETIARAQDLRVRSMVHTRTFVVVAASLPGLAAASTLVNGALMGAAVAVSIVCAAILTRLVPRFAGRVAQVPVALMLNAVVAILLGFALRAVEPVAHQALGLYPVLACASGMASILVAEMGLETAEGERFTAVDIVFAAVSAVVVLAACGCLTELLSTGQVLGVAAGPLANSSIAIFGKSSGSLLILALVAIIVQATERSHAGAEDGKEGERA